MKIHGGAAGKVLWLIVAATQLAFADTENPALRGQQLQLPNDIEQKASYCLAVSKLRYSEIVSLVNNAESKARSVTDPATRAMVDEVIQSSRKLEEKFNDNVNRLQLFLNPRISYLEPSAMLAAYSRGETDYYKQQDSQKFNQCRDKCMVNGTHEDRTSCLKGCMEEDDVNRRILQCRDLSFLPY